MLRLAVLFALLALAVAGQAQTFSRGAPASVVSPEADGRQHGIPAGATSPGPDGRLHGIPASASSPQGIPMFVNPGASPFLRTGHGPRRRFGTGKGHDDGHGRLLFVPVPLFYPIYPDAAYPVADPNVQAPEQPAEQAAAATYSDPAPPANASSVNANSEDALRAAYLQGARDALTQQQQSDPRYGSHYMDSRERSASPFAERTARKRQSEQSDAAAAVPAKESEWPATVFILKDGSQIETRNFAIMGQTLFDFSSKTLKKIELADVDKDATVKANEDRGIQVKLP
ncbi:MAG TPA: hypothetical protein VF532_03755 [Candidatus Angelobacter sp.]